MPNKPLNTDLFDKAAHFAINAHAGTERRGKGFPYIIHPFEAAEIVATMTSDPELLAAAMLHDTVEDTDVTLEQIEAEFGPRVAAIVRDESDSGFDPKKEKATWRVRKQAAIDRLAAASHDAKIVAMGDKLSNMRAIARDYYSQGDKLWDLFHAPGGRSDHEWHYWGLARSLSELRGTFAFSEFTYLIRKVFGVPKPELIDMSEWTVSGDGYTAVSYNHCDGTRMMKLYANYIPLRSVENEFVVNQNICDLGINTPQAIRLVTDGERNGIEFERIQNKKSFARAIKDDPSTLRKYALELAAEVKKLHSVKCNTAVFSSASDFIKNQVKVCPILNEEEKARIIAYVDSIPECNTCIHGDLHLGNIITDGKRNWWIDLGDFRYGNPLLDLGMFAFLVYVSDPAINERIFHISFAQLREFWNIFATAYFEKPLDQIEKIIRPIGSLYSICLGNREKFYDWMITDIRENLLKKI